MDVDPGIMKSIRRSQKDIPLTEQLKLEFRAEAFNLLNHPIYGDPDSDVSDGPGEFGVITTQLNSGATGIGSSRRLQFMLRLEF